MVAIAEDAPARIVLQHLLVVEAEGVSQVIEHWSQVWTWQDTRILDYAGSDGVDVWQRHTVATEQASGCWSQLVTSVDDTPRYESPGTWVHELGESLFLRLSHLPGAWPVSSRKALAKWLRLPFP